MNWVHIVFAGLVPHYGDVPGWITAGATLGLLVGAIVTARYAIKAFGEQTKELEVLRQQAKDQSAQLKLQGEQFDEQRKINEKQAEVAELQAEELKASRVQREREATERRRRQAAQVFIWEWHHASTAELVGFAAAAAAQEGLSRPVVTAYLKNTSEQPVYNVIISWHLGNVRKGLSYRMPLMPGAEDKDTQPVPARAKPGRFGAVVFFRDAAGVTWRARPDGQLDEIPAQQVPPRPDWAPT